MNKPRTILFGASKGGERFLRRCGSAFEIVAFCDNDPKKHGQTLSGLPILPPARLQDIPHDRNVIASMFGHEIKEQLVRQFGIPEARIQFAPKSALSPNKTYRPFEDPPTLELARRMLEWIDDLLRAARIPYFVDHGTLLGLFRDGDLLPWDDDLDLSVPQDHIAATLSALQARQTRLPHADRLDWMAETVVDSDTGRILGLLLCYPEQNSLNLRKFAASIWFMFPEKGQIRQYINAAPDRFFQGHDHLRFRGRPYPIPLDAPRYLEIHYGDWRTPVRDMSLEEIRNYRPPPPRVRREVLFGTPDQC